MAMLELWYYLNEGEFHTSFTPQDPHSETNLFGSLSCWMKFRASMAALLVSYGALLVALISAVAVEVLPT